MLVKKNKKMTEVYNNGKVTPFNNRSNKVYQRPNNTSGNIQHPKKKVMYDEITDVMKFVEASLEVFKGSYESAIATLNEIVTMEQFQGTSFMNESTYLIEHFAKPQTAGTVTIAQHGQKVKPRTMQQVRFPKPKFLSYRVECNHFLYNTGNMETITAWLTDRLAGMLALLRRYQLIVHEAIFKCYNYNDQLTPNEFLRQTELLFGSVGIFNRATKGSDQMHTTFFLTSIINVLRANVPLTDIMFFYPESFKNFYLNMQNNQYNVGKDLLERNLEDMNFLQMADLKTDLMPAGGRLRIIPNPYMPMYNDIEQCVETYVKWRFVILVKAFQIKGNAVLCIPGANHQIRKLSKDKLVEKLGGATTGAVLIITKQYCAVGYSGILVAQNTRITGPSGKNTMLQGRKTIVVPYEDNIPETEVHFYQEKYSVEVQPRLPEMGRLLPAAELSQIMYCDSMGCPCNTDDAKDEVATYLSPEEVREYEECMKSGPKELSVVPWSRLEKYFSKGGDTVHALYKKIVPKELDMVLTIPTPNDDDTLKMAIDICHSNSGCIAAEAFYAGAEEGSIMFPPSMPKAYSDALPVLLNSMVPFSTLRNNLATYRYATEEEHVEENNEQNLHNNEENNMDINI